MAGFKVSAEAVASGLAPVSIGALEAGQGSVFFCIGDLRGCGCAPVGVDVVRVDAFRWSHRPNIARTRVRQADSSPAQSHAHR
jgi:hypothetical protein